MLVSHDVHLIETTCDRLWLVDEGTVKVFDGDLDEYKQLLLDKKRTERQGSEKKTVNGNGPVNKKELRRTRAAQRAEANNLLRFVKDAERRMEKLNADIAKVEVSLADATLYEGAVTMKLISSIPS